MSLKSIFLVTLSIIVFVEGVPKNKIKEVKAVEVDSSKDDQLTSGSVATGKALDLPVAATGVKPIKASPTDLKSSNSFGLGYYFPIVTPFVKYHYPLIYYHPTTYIHSIRHHGGYGAYGFYHHGHSVLH